MINNSQKSYMNPYFAGVGLGLVLLFTFIFIGRGIGVSGAFAKVSSTAVDLVASNSFVADYSLRGKTLLDYWILIEVIGIFFGGLISSKFAGRRKKAVVKGANITNKERFKYAFIGGILMGIGSRLARGCTSGQALTGGALLSIGSWSFMISIFIGGYLLANRMKRAWL